MLMLWHWLLSVLLPSKDPTQGVNVYPVVESASGGYVLRNNISVIKIV